MSFDAQFFVQAEEIAKHECSLEGCTNGVAATYSTVREIAANPRRVEYEFVWARSTATILGHTR
jgi:hypothetical protein